MDLAADNAQKAFDLRSRVSEQEKLYVSSRYYWTVLGDLDQESHTYQVWAQTYPRDPDPHNDLGVNLKYFGNYADALREHQEATRLDPNFRLAWGNLANDFVALNRLDEAKQQAVQGLRRWPNDGALHSVLYHVAFLQNDTKEMGQQVAALAGKPDEDFMLVVSPIPKPILAAPKIPEELFRRVEKIRAAANTKQNAANPRPPPHSTRPSLVILSLRGAWLPLLAPLQADLPKLSQHWRSRGRGMRPAPRCWPMN